MSGILYYKEKLRRFNDYLQRRVLILRHSIESPSLDPDVKVDYEARLDELMKLSVFLRDPKTR